MSNRFLLGGLAGALALAAVHPAMAWRGSATYHGYSGATTYHGANGGRAVQGPNGNWAAQGPRGSTATGNGHGSWNATGYRGGTASGSNGQWSATGYRGNTVNGTTYYGGGNVYHGTTYYGTAYPYGAVAAGVAVGTAAAVASTPAPYYYPPTYGSPPPAPSAAGGAPPDAPPCFAALSPASQQIFERSVPAVKSGTPLRDAVTAATRSLVMSGAVPRGSAQADAQAAGACLAQAAGAAPGAAPPPAAAAAAATAGGPPSCFASLSPAGKEIFEKSAPAVQSGTPLKDAVTNTTRSLVMSGAISQGSARADAQAAGTCLAQAK